MTEERIVLHVDMDAFYASIEQADNPEFDGLPVLVGGTGPRGVVAAASYEAREFGVHSAMPMSQALERCPQAVCVRPRFDRYQELSKQIFGIFRQFTPLVEGLSLDEAFLDVTDSLTLFGDGSGIAWEIKRRIKEKTRLTASVGIAPNKLVAKIASDLDKPDGFCLVAPGEVNRILDPLPVRKLNGIGPKTAQQLTESGIHTLGELRNAPERLLEPVFGRYTSRVRARAAGLDDRPVVPYRMEKSISAEETFDKDIADIAKLNSILAQLSDRTATRLRAKELMAGKVWVKIRRGDFRTVTRQCSMRPPGHETQNIYLLASKLLSDWLDEHPGTALRLIGVGVSDISPAQQLTLFDEQPRESAGAVDDAVDRIRQRFGDGFLHRGGALKS